MATIVAALVEGVVTILKITSSREIEYWKQQKFDLEIKNLDFDGENHERQKSLIGRRINELDEKPGMENGNTKILIGTNNWQ